MVSDPVGMHYVDSFSKPGHNVTGFTPFEPSLGGKWVSLLKEIAPNIQHIGLVYNPEPGNNSAAFRESIDKTAGASGIASVETPSGGDSDIERLIVSLKDKPDSGLIFLPDAFTYRNLIILQPWSANAAFQQYIHYVPSARLGA